MTRVLRIDSGPIRGPSFISLAPTIDLG